MANHDDSAARWQEVDRLISEQKFQAALDATLERLEVAREGRDLDDATRALIKATQLRVGLHGTETAVRFLREQPWPDGERSRLILELYYARTLATYLQSYSWEISQRERVETGEEVDLRAWTREQIAAEAQAAYIRAWGERETWGAESLGDLAEYIEQNDYPPRIRATLRDAVSYLWSELLVDSQLWSPRQSNEVWRLDLERLASAAVGELDDSPGVAVDDPDTHPLAKAARVLADLEGWHLENARPEAAFEAARRRIELLWSHAQGEPKRERLVEVLANRLEELGSRLPWWTMGQATLAEKVRDLGDYPRAHALAEAGARAFPKSIGGQRCRNLVAALEQPQFSLRAMAFDSPGKRSIAVSHKGIDQLHFRAYALDFEQVLTTSRDYNLLPARREIEAILGQGEPSHEWSEDLPPTPDFRQHRTFVTPPMEDPGLYLIVASARPGFLEGANQRTALGFFVSDLVMIERRVGDGVEVTVRSGSTGRPVAGAELDLYELDYRQGHRKLDTFSTAADGRWTFAGTTTGRNRFLVARHGEHRVFKRDSLVQQRRGVPNGSVRSALVTTDRAVYRPGQTVHFKVIAYSGDRLEGRFETLRKAPVTMRLRDANYEEVATLSLTTNAFGTTSGEFEIPTGRLLGGWQLECDLGGGVPIRVEEYKRPTFEVELLEPEDALRLNRPAVLRGEARYYFGLPVAEGEVAWRVVRQPRFPRWWWFAPPSNPQTLASGSSNLSPEGGFEIEFVPEADESLGGEGSGVSYSYQLSVDVTDEGGETRSTSRAFRLGFVAIEASIERPSDFVRHGEPIRLDVSRSDLDGAPRAGEGQWRLVALEGPTEALLPAELPVGSGPLGGQGIDGHGSRPESASDYQTEGDRLRPRWQVEIDPIRQLARWSAGREQASGTVEHGADGKASITLDRLRPGAYRMLYTTQDAFGAEVETRTELVVARAGAEALSLPMVLLAESDRVAVGETARFLVQSGLEDQEMVLEVVRGDDRLERRLLRSGDGVQLLELPVDEKLRGGFGVRLTAVRDHQLMAVSVPIRVPWDDRALDVELSRFRDRLTPGATETWAVTVRGEDDEALAAGAAEVLALMYDRSLDLFASFQPRKILDLYPSLAGASIPGSTLGANGEVWRSSQGFGRLPNYPRLRGDQLRFYDNYAIGGPGFRGGGRMLRKTQMMAEGMPRDIPPSPSPPAAMRAMAVEADAAPSEAFFESVDDTAVSLEAGDASDDGGQGDAPPVDTGGDSLRTDFSETAFFHPHLLTDADGSVRFEFTVPDSVTEWNVWVQAVTRDLRGGLEHRTTRTVKDLLVRPYLPRFLREGDRAELRVVINNTADRVLAGTFDLAIADPETGADLRKELGLAGVPTHDVAFEVAPGQGTTLTFPLVAPRRVGPLTVEAVARADGTSDGERRALPLLPSRLRLAQSRFATLDDKDRRTLRFEDLAADDDPSLTSEQLVVTLEAQLFYSVLNALPYLVEYPYSCTEQTLNRFVSTGIVSSLYDQYPAVATMARQLSDRETRLTPWNDPDPNRRMLLEESPWLRRSRGEDTGPDASLINVLDPAIAARTRAEALAELEKAQTSLGGFPWWPGGPPSPHMTLYLLMGFSRAVEFDVEVPQPMVQKAWSYLHRHYVDEIARRMVDDGCCVEMVTFLNYVLSSYPDVSWTGGVFSDDDRRRMLDHSFAHWQKHSPLIKGYLALTLERAGRGEDARLVWDSVMDSSRTDPDLGTFWAPEERSWLWYNDTVESQAFALRVLAELDPTDDRRKGLVQWLFLDKKLGHWKSTRATAEAVYALAHYLDGEDQLGTREAATVRLGPVEREFVFEPDQYTGHKAQLRIEGEDVTPEMASVEVSKETPGLMFATATWHFATDRLPEVGDGDFFHVERSYFRRVNNGEEWVLEPLGEGAPLAVGDQLEVQLSIRAKHAAEYVHLRDPRGAGFEPEKLTSGYRWDLGLGFYEEVRDSGTNFFFDWLPVGEYTLKYRLRATTAGTFRVGPATLQSLYAPEFTAYSSGRQIAIAGE